MKFVVATVIRFVLFCCFQLFGLIKLPGPLETIWLSIIFPIATFGIAILFLTIVCGKGVIAAWRGETPNKSKYEIVMYGGVALILFFAPSFMSLFANVQTTGNFLIDGIVGLVIYFVPKFLCKAIFPKKIAI